MNVNQITPIKNINQNNENKFNNNFDIDNELYELTRCLSEIKKERIKSSKDENVLNKRIRLLSSEEMKANRRQLLESRAEKKLEKIRLNILKDKAKLDENKLKQLKKLEEKKARAVDIRNKIKNSISQWRKNVKEKNIKSNNNYRTIRKDIEILIEKDKYKDLEKKKLKHDKMHFEQMLEYEKRKKEEMDKKLKLKKKLEKQILQETKLKQIYDKKILEHQHENEALIKRINEIYENNDINSVHTSNTIIKKNKINEN